MKKLCVLALILLMLPFAAAYGVTFYSPQQNPQYGKVYEAVEPDTPYTVEDTKDRDVAITRITFTITREAKNAGITVYHLMVPPDSLPKVPENDSYEFNELKYSGFVPHDTKKLVYDFRVQKSWLENNSVPRNSVILHAYDSKTDTWEALPTKIVSDDDYYVYFRAEGIGYHYLLIGKSQSDATSSLVKSSVEEVEKPGEKETGMKDSPDITTDVTPVQLGQQPAAQVPPSPAPVPSVPVEPKVEKKEVSSDSKLLGAFILVAIAVIVLVIYLVFGKRKLGSSVEKELDRYIGESLKRGRSKEEVRQRLMDVGWHHDRIDRALSRHKVAGEVKPEPVARHEPADIMMASEAHPAHKPAPKSKPAPKAKKK